MGRAKRGINIRQFADRRGWNWRAVYRDIATLRAAGVPVEHEHGWYRIPENWIPVGAVDIKRDELVALQTLRALVAGLRGTPLGQSLESLSVKLASTSRQVPLPLPERAWLLAAPSNAIDYRDHGSTLVALRDAIERKHALQLRYRRPTGEETLRVVEPAFVWWDARLETLYLRAWCRLRASFRTFAVQRIMSVAPLAESFVPRADATRELANAFRTWCGSVVERVVLRFSAAVAPEIRERRLHPTQQLVAEASDGSITIELRVAAPMELERCLLGFGPDVQILEPTELAARVAERHRRAITPADKSEVAENGRARAGMLRARTRTKVVTRPTRRTRSAMH